MKSAAVISHEAPHDREPEPAVCIAATRFIESHERLQRTIQLTAWNAAAVIAYLECVLAVAAGRRNFHRRLAVSECVLDQIGQNPVEVDKRQTKTIAGL